MLENINPIAKKGGGGIGAKLGSIASPVLSTVGGAVGAVYGGGAGWAAGSSLGKLAGDAIKTATDASQKGGGINVVQDVGGLAGDAVGAGNSVGNMPGTPSGATPLQNATANSPVQQTMQLMDAKDALNQSSIPQTDRGPIMNQYNNALDVLNQRRGVPSTPVTQVG